MSRMRGFLVLVMTLAAVALAGGWETVRAASASFERRLANGLAVQVASDPRLPLVRLQLMIPAGSALDPRGQGGVASVAAEILKQGTPTRDARALIAELDRMSGTLTITVARDYVLIQGAFLARDAEAAVELLSDIVVASLLDEDHVQLARRGAMRAIVQFRQNPSNLVEDHLWRTVYEGHGYGSPRLGTLVSIDRIKTEQVRFFHLANYVPGRSVLSFSGDLDPERAFGIAERWFGRWTDRSANAGTAPPAGGAARSGLRHVRLVDRPDLTTAEIRIGFAGPARGASDELAFGLAGGILGSSPGSRLALLSAAKQIGPDARTWLLQMRNGSLFGVGVSADPDSAIAAVDVLMAELRRFASEPPREDEVAAVRRYASQSRPLQLDSPSARLLQWGMASFTGLREDFVSGYDARIAAVDVGAVQSAIQRWLDPDRASLVVVGPRARLEKELAKFGTVEVVEAEALDPTGAAEAVTASQAPDRDQIAKGRALARRAVEVHGGQKRLSGIADSDVEGDITFLLQGREIPGKLRQLRKDPYRMVYTTKLAELSTHQTLNGERAWSVATAGDGEPRDTDTLGVRGLRTGFSTDLPHLLLGAVDPASEVFLRGRDSIESRPVDALVVRTAAGDRRVLYLDAANHRLLAIDQQDAESGSAPFASRRIYRDYRPVNGILWPWAEDRYLGGEHVMKVRYTRVGLNAGVEDAVFERPESALPPPAR